MTAGPIGRLREVVGTLISREIGVLTNAIAFNFLLCLFPLLAVIAALARSLPGGGRRGAAALLLVLQELIPFGHEAMAESVRNFSRTTAAMPVAALLVVVWGSSGIFMPVEMALSRAWGGRKVRSFVHSKLLAFAMTLGCGLLALMSIALTLTVRMYGSGWPMVVRHSGKAVALALSYLLFFLVYRVVPEAVGTRTALRAALVAGTAWELVKYVFVARLPGLRLEAFYGPMAFSVSLIIWAYVSSLVLVFGALVVPVQRARSRRK